MLKQKDYVSAVFNRLKNCNTYFLKLVSIAASVIVCLSATVAVYAAEFSSAVEIRYNNRLFGYVANSSEADNVKEKVMSRIYGGFDGEGFSFKNATVSKNDVLSADSISMSVINNADGIKPACGLYVDGVLKAIANDYATINTYLSEGIKYFTADGFEFVGFENTIVLRDIFATEDYAKRLEISLDALLNGEYGVQFKTVRTEQFEREFAFKEVIEYNNSKKTSYEKIKQKGQNGVESITAEVTYINGQSVLVNELRSVVTTPAVEQIKVKGTKKSPVYHSGYVLATKYMDKSSATMVFPVACNGDTYISSFWGDGRGHKGLDIAAPKNTKIYAAADGVVTYSGYRSDYGYMIIVDHNDGKTQTVYSHNSKNLVKVGDTVSAGQQIANVGATGNATGNHLHFEVRINGTPVDAAPYVGLY